MALREAAWPAVGEELEAKSNGLWHRATVAEIGQGWPGNVRNVEEMDGKRTDMHRLPHDFDTYFVNLRNTL